MIRIIDQDGYRLALGTV